MQTPFWNPKFTVRFLKNMSWKSQTADEKVLILQSHFPSIMGKPFKHCIFLRVDRKRSSFSAFNGQHTFPVFTEENYYCSFLKKLFIYFNWRLITSHCCSGFCLASTWISHGCICVPPSWAPSRPIPLGYPSAPALSALPHSSSLYRSPIFA